MTQLIMVSALLGVGAGMIIPLSTALVSKFFSGAERTRQYGYVSAITNISLVVATALTGWLADIQWRLPFLVYLLPLLSIMLVPAIKRGEGALSHEDDGFESPVAGRIEYGTLSEYMLYYLLITCLVMAMSINLPFLLGDLGHDSGVSGVVLSLFFLAMMLPGLFLNRILAVVKGRALLLSLLLIMLGLADIFLNRSLPFIIVGCLASGVGYGIAQPYIYDRTASLATGKKVTYALALVMTMNYVAIVIAPFIIRYLQEFTGLKGNAAPFLINAVIAALALAYMLLRKLVLKR
jgi:MFS family permease